ncbi:MAG: hypothetical protein JW795_16550 [Chitinivibrionales bacterium]|nr:hypothetical protein [Chitinivibrionales bacterium]
MIAVTGIFGSGVNCIADFLIHCGFNRGSTHPLCDPDNTLSAYELGHFENRSVITINETILRMAGGSWRQVPSNREVLDTGFRVRRMIEKFSELFDGTLIVDPRLCLTTSLWEEFSPNLEKLVLCNRHPLTIASTLKETENLPLHEGLQLWYTYMVRCIQGACMIPVIVVDADCMVRDMAATLEELAYQVGVSCDERIVEMIKRHHWPELALQMNEPHNRDVRLPQEVGKLYEMVAPDGDVQQMLQSSAYSFFGR